MKPLSGNCIALVLSISFVLLFVGCSTEKKSPKRVILLGLDGLSVEGFQTAAHPNIDSLFEDGVISFNTRTVMPSVTLPNWTSHLTAAGPEQHGVFENGWKKENHSLEPQEMDAEGYFPSIFKIVKDQVPNIKTAYYYNWKSLINPINQTYLDEVNFEENDEYSENYQAALDFIENNKSLPTLTFLYSVHVDHAGHRHQWMSPEYITAIEEVDNKIGEFVKQLKAKGLYQNTHFLLFTDHGGVGNGHGGTSPQEMEVPWMIKGPGIKKGFELTTPNSNTNTAAIIAHLFDIAQTPEAWIGKVPDEIIQDK
ncbi:nucleotide pyrophosphatase [Echinicola strongylocentroti]|uniref:Nucleotide pyrophosphatase n=1 Tax=Echinicola strongylocentroti TaxID=1795355 RepID=A0A2Z4IPC5_9BACT|nr:alkaline phosphatase [Echinicola strongylocentroti]AWW32203.1 nucleotide pyrophosphatase [Echinicola strongylocentroti]